MGYRSDVGLAVKEELIKSEIDTIKDEGLKKEVRHLLEKETDEDGHTTLREDARMETPMGVVIKTEIIIEAITAYLLEKGFI